MHTTKGKSIAQCLSERIDYGTNPEKTQNSELISSFACEPRTADAEFLASKKRYEQITGRCEATNVIAYQVRQSFKPGEVSPEEANQIGYDFAMRFLKGKHAFIVCTHTDKRHVHNHIYWNSTTLDCTRKFRDFHRSGKAVRTLSDLICTEHKNTLKRLCFDNEQQRYYLHPENKEMEDIYVSSLRVQGVATYVIKAI